MNQRKQGCRSSLMGNIVSVPITIATALYFFNMLLDWRNGYD